MSARKQAVEDFFDETGAETLAAIGLATTTLTKTLYSIFALVCLAGLIANCVYFVQAYNKFDTTTNVEVP